MLSRSSRLQSLCRVIFVPLLLATSTSIGLAQHTPHEIAVSIAIDGQNSFVRDVSNPGFYTAPFIGRVQYAAWTDGVQSVSLFLETVGETRDRVGLWAYPTTDPVAFDSRISERLSMTTLGLELVRTLISESGFRLAVGAGAGFGLGGARADVQKVGETSTTSYNATQSWDAVFISVLTRARYTLWTDGKRDLGLTLTLRYWGFPSIGPLTNVADTYNGPALRSLNELGYLTGISFGF
ncbi:MAG: hypothetical protein ABI252_09275 [Candidatus Kapaibacterium sp.]|jgi:hypothetical protein